MVAGCLLFEKSEELREARPQYIMVDLSKLSQPLSTAIEIDFNKAVKAIFCEKLILFSQEVVLYDTGSGRALCLNRASSMKVSSKTCSIQSGILKSFPFNGFDILRLPACLLSRARENRKADLQDLFFAKMRW